MRRHISIEAEQSLAEDPAEDHLDAVRHFFQNVDGPLASASCPLASASRAAASARRQLENASRPVASASWRLASAGKAAGKRGIANWQACRRSSAMVADLRGPHQSCRRRGAPKKFRSTPRLTGFSGAQDYMTLTPTEVRALRAIVDIQTAATVLGIGRTVAYQLVRTGRFPTPVVRVGKQIKIPTAYLLDLLGLSTETPDNGRIPEESRTKGRPLQPGDSP